MAKKEILKDRQGNSILPITTTACVLDGGGYLSDTLNDIPRAERYVGDVENVFGVTREDLKKDLFVDMWNSACKFKTYSSAEEAYGRYNNETGFFELNGLTDITYEEAIDIYTVSKRYLEQIYVDNHYWGNVCNDTCFKNVRTLLPISVGHNGYLRYAFTNITPNFTLSRIRLIVDKYVVNLTSCFSGNRGLTHVLGKINISNITDSTKLSGIFNLTSIKEFDFYGLKCDFQISTAIYNTAGENITLQTFKNLVSQALNTTPITITIPNSIYNAIVGENTQYPFNEGTREEWLALNDLAISKQISFATN